MAEYIERDAAIQAMCYGCTEINICNGVCDDTDRLRNIPAADVRPVVHGRWTGHDIGNGRLSIDDDTCSLCGSRFYQVAETECVWHYCPNCGARMDGTEPPKEGTKSCDTCRHAPPSSLDGKPCTMCDTSNPLTSCWDMREESE